MKKMILIIGLIMGTMAYGSWWGHRSRASRAGMVIGTAVVLNEIYNANNRGQNCRNYNNQNSYPETCRRYENYYDEEGNKYLDRYCDLYGHEENCRRENRKITTGKIVFSDDKTQIIELSNGERIIINK